jgi:hypothetical protein
MKVAFASALANALFAGCVAPTDTDDSEALSRGDEPAEQCTSMPACSNTPYITPYINALQRQLGCDTTRRFTTGVSAGFIGGLGSFCPDTAYVRSQLRAGHYRGWESSYCNDCIEVRGGQLFVFWTIFMGPGCPGGCEPMPPPGGF